MQRKLQFCLCSAFFSLLIISFFISQAEANLVNLTQVEGVTASANTQYDDYFPAYAIDGDYSTKWLGDWWGSDERPQELTVDLGFDANVDHINFYFSNHYDHLPPNEPDMMFDVYSSLDGINWLLAEQQTVSVFHGLLQTSTAAATGPGDPYYDVTVNMDMGQSMRHVYFDVVGGWAWAHLNEMEIIGSPSPVPIPTTMLLLGTGLLGLAGVRLRRKK